MEPGMEVKVVGALAWCCRRLSRPAVRRAAAGLTTSLSTVPPPLDVPGLALWYGCNAYYVSAFLALMGSPHPRGGYSMHPLVPHPAFANAGPYAALPLPPHRGSSQPGARVYVRCRAVE